MRANYHRTLERVIRKPTPADIRWTDTVAMLSAAGVEINQRAGVPCAVKERGRTDGDSPTSPGTGDWEGDGSRHRCFPRNCRSQTMMKYKGYIAEVEFDESVGRLHGRVVNCGPYPIATFEATDVDGIRREFHCSIDEYLKSCREDGIEPRKSYSGKLNVRLGPDLHQRVSRSAAESRLSLNSWIVQTLEQSVSE